MEWTEKIKKGMELIGAGCNDIGGFVSCQMNDCPFGHYCWAILKKQWDGEDTDLIAPEYWNNF